MFVRRNKKFLLPGLAALALLLTLTLGLLWLRPKSHAALSPLSSRAPLILDAGHGGEDGGAVSVTGVPESQINLSIVRKLDGILGFYGQPAVLLRQEDVSLHDEDAQTLRQKKTSDLHNRVELVEKIDGGILVSIHQNSYPEARYHGAQVFYAPTQGSQALGQHLQMALRDGLDSENTRAAKQIPDTVYLMNHVGCPAVLVECGFLTNPTEEAMLRSEDYQRKLAAVLAGGLLTRPQGPEALGTVR